MKHTTSVRAHLRKGKMVRQYNRKFTLKPIEWGSFTQNPYYDDKSLLPELTRFENYLQKKYRLKEQKKR